MVIVIEGDCLDIMKIMDDNTFDSIVTDPPYALVGGSRGGSLSIGDKTTPYGRSGPSKNGVSIAKGFMGKEWDGKLPSVEVWKECLRVVKPGAHMLAFGGTRTHHRLMCAIEDAGWEIRDTLNYAYDNSEDVRDFIASLSDEQREMLMRAWPGEGAQAWVYGSGFPKSLNISKSLDKAAGAEREVIGNRTRVYGYEKDYHNSFDNALFDVGNNNKITAPTTDIAKLFDGWGTSLKPAWEPIILCRKPLEGTVAQNVLKYGCGGINIDGCRVAINPDVDDKRLGGNGKWTTTIPQTIYGGGNGIPRGEVVSSDKGRFPANLIHDGSNEVLALFPNTQASKGKYVRKTGNEQFLGVMGDGRTNNPDGLCDSGSAARFFYCAKASRAERNDGCEDLFTLKSNTSLETIEEIKKLLNNNF